MSKPCRWVFALQCCLVRPWGRVWVSGCRWIFAQASLVSRPCRWVGVVSAVEARRGNCLCCLLRLPACPPACLLMAHQCPTLSCSALRSCRCSRCLPHAGPLPLLLSPLQMVEGLKVATDKKAAAEQVKALYKLFAEKDCTMVEVGGWAGGWVGGRGAAAAGGAAGWVCQGAAATAETQGLRALLS